MSKSTTTTTIIFFIFSISILLVAASPESQESELYAAHCNPTLLSYPTTTTDQHISTSITARKLLQINHGHFTGGDPFLNTSDPDSLRFSLAFSISSLRPTQNPSLLQINASLNFLLFQLPQVRHRGLKELRFRGPKFPVGHGGGGGVYGMSGLRFQMYGFWDGKSGQGCMVGAGAGNSNGKSLNPNGVFRFRYMNSSTIVDSLVTGVVESVDGEASPAYFKPVSLIGASLMNDYKYTLVENQTENWDVGIGEAGLNGVRYGGGFCSMVRKLMMGMTDFGLMYGSECGDLGRRNRSCNPLLRVQEGEVLPVVMSLVGFKCLETEERVRLLIKFLNARGRRYGAFSSLLPDVSLIGEGAWDGEKNQLRIAACKILNYTDSLADAKVGDCSVRLSLVLPGGFSLRNRSQIVGVVWSAASADSPSYFDKVGVFSSWAWSGFSSSLLAGVKYEYTVVDVVNKTCSVDEKKKKGKGRYPDAYSRDMYLNMHLKLKNNRVVWGSGAPLSVGDKILTQGSTVYTNNSSFSSVVNISYALNFERLNFYNLTDQTTGNTAMSAEGVYNSQTGNLCMVGCLLNRASNGVVFRNESLDCEIRINIQFPSLDSGSKDHVKGTILSTRAQTDPHYFGSMGLTSNSMYVNQAEESIWQMDFEITLVLLSKTLSCVFLGLQLYYIRRYPGSSPSISILMLIILALGHMIPLLLNFEALFVDSHDRTNVSLDGGGWLAVNEVIVRVVTMVAFLLQFRLLHLAWSSRLTDAKSKGLWNSEKKVLYSSLPIYIGGALVAWLLRKSTAPLPDHLGLIFRGPHYQIDHPVRHPVHNPVHNQLSALWGSLKSYGGLVHDGFLLPQIIFNLFQNSQVKALAYSFYIGTTFLRVFPHLYDLYRTHKNYDFSSLKLVYANHVLDFYSTAWNIVIPGVGLLFAALIFCQQRFGGRSVLPERFRQSNAYEKVSVISNEQQ